jgi:hypothetical protein
MAYGLRNQYYCGCDDRPGVLIALIGSCRIRIYDYRVPCGVCGALVLPGVPAAEQHLQVVVAVSICIVELLRHTGAFILGRSLAVGDHELIFGYLVDAGIYVRLRERYSSSYVPLII